MSTLGPGFNFGGNTGLSAKDLWLARERYKSAMGQQIGNPNTVGGGLNALGTGIMQMLSRKRLAEAEEAERVRQAQERQAAIALSNKTRAAVAGGTYEPGSVNWSPIYGLHDSAEGREVIAALHRRAYGVEKPDMYLKEVNGQLFNTRTRERVIDARDAVYRDGGFFHPETLEFLGWADPETRAANLAGIRADTYSTEQETIRANNQVPRDVDTHLANLALTEAKIAGQNEENWKTIEISLPDGSELPVHFVEDVGIPHIQTEKGYEPITDPGVLKVLREGGAVPVKEGEGAKGTKSLEALAKHKGFQETMLEASATMEDMRSKGFDPTSRWSQIRDTLGAAGRVWTALGPHSEEQVYKQAATRWLEPLLRINTGAAAPEPEHARLARGYFPVLGDSEKAIEIKRRARKKFQETHALALGALDPTTLSPEKGAQIYAAVLQDIQNALLEGLPPEEAVEALKNIYDDSAESVLSEIAEEATEDDSELDF